jgi:chemotaxis protein MotB
MRTLIILFAAIALLLSSCGISKDVHNAVIFSRDSLENVVANLNSSIADQKAKNTKTIENLQTKIAELSDVIRKNHDEIDKLNNELKKLRADYELVSKNYEETKSSSNTKLQALMTKLEQSRKELEDREARLREVESALHRQDSIMKSLHSTITNALLGFKDSGITVEVKNGKVYVTLSNQLLFKTGSTAIDKRGKEALVELSEVLLKHPDIQILIEGHTDNVPVSGGGRFIDNWDLSVLRSTEVIRVLTGEGLDPKRITAAGRGEYYPVETGDSPDARAKNRRTDIILSPKLDILYEMINK